MILQELQGSYFRLCWVSQRFHLCPMCWVWLTTIHLGSSQCETSQYLFYVITVMLSHYPKLMQPTVNSLKVKYLPIRDFFIFPSQRK